MAEKLLNAKVLQRIDTLANWNASNPVLRKGEICIISDTNEIKIGDGTSTFKNLRPLTISGNAYSASKLKTPRNIEFSGDINGKTTFDGSTDASIDITVNKISGQTSINNESSIQDILNWLSNVSSK